MRSIYKIFPAALILVAFLTACTNSTRGARGGDVIVRVGDSELTLSELRRQLPAGVSATDSVRLARSFVRSWIDSRLMSEIAAKNIGDMAEIDRMTNEYRNELIAYEYRRKLIENRLEAEFSEDSLRSFYNDNARDFVALRPLVKGVFVKVPNSSPQLKELRSLYTSTKTTDMDRLEKKEFGGDIHFDYFRDRWVDWEQIEQRIPYDFGTNPSAFLSSNKKLDFSDDDFTYLLSISEYIPSGAVLPFEYARDDVYRELVFRRRVELDREIRKELLREADESGHIEIFCDLDS